MLRVPLRLFAKKSPLFESSHRYTLPKTSSSVGPSHKAERLYDPDRLHKLQHLVKDKYHTAGLSLTDSVKNLAKTDLEFNEFLKTFKDAEEPDHANLLDSPNMLDMKSYLKDPNRSAKDRLDELHMHDQLRKKLIAEQLYEEHSKVSMNFLHDNLDKGEDRTIRQRDSIHRGQIGEEIFFNTEGFKIMFIHAGSTTNITKLARFNKRHVLLYMGNTDGIISYGKGVGNSYQDAWKDAMYNMKKNLICINLDHFYTTPGYLVGHFNDTTVEIFPSFTNKAWGNPLYYNIMALAGLNNFRFRLRSRNVNKYAIIYCFFKCLTQNTTPRMIAERNGEKIYEISYGRPLRQDFNSSFYSF